MNVLIIPDKFKGTLTATQAAQAMAKGWQRVRREDDIELLPMSDGGDGFGELLAAAMGAEARPITTIDAAHRRRKALWWWDAANQTAIIESAQIIGLGFLPRGKYHPFDLDTEGLGVAVQEAVAAGARRCIIGIGGSATNDAAFGLARALGWQFLDRQGNEIQRWTDLAVLADLVAPKKKRPFASLLVAVDVQNPLLGAKGCSRIYGPQKGLLPEDMKTAEAALRKLAKVSAEKFGKDLAKMPGAGAAGGLGFGLSAFLGGKLTPGFDLFAKYSGIPAKLKEVDLVITGEGSIDKSSVMGKGVGELVQACQKAFVPCIGLGGQVDASVRRKSALTWVGGMAPDLTDAETAIAKPWIWLTKLAEKAAREYGA